MAQTWEASSAGAGVQVERGLRAGARWTPAEMALLVVTCGWAAAVLGAWWRTSPLFGATLFAVSPILLRLMVIDVREHRLPNPLTGLLAAVSTLGLGLTAIVDPTPGGPLRAALGAVTLGGFYLTLCLVGGGSGMGLGDAKLAPSLGALLGWVGWETWLSGMFLAFIAGGLWAVALMVRGHGRKARIPFGPFMIGAAMVSLFPP